MRKPFFVVRDDNGYIQVFRKRPRFVTTTERVFVRYDANFSPVYKNQKVTRLKGIAVLSLCSRGFTRITGGKLRKREIRKVRLSSL